MWLVRRNISQITWNSHIQNIYFFLVCRKFAREFEWIGVESKQSVLFNALLTDAMPGYVSLCSSPFRNPFNSFTTELIVHHLICWLTPNLPPFWFLGFQKNSCFCSSTELLGCSESNFVSFFLHDRRSNCTFSLPVSDLGR